MNKIITVENNIEKEQVLWGKSKQKKLHIWQTALLVIINSDGKNDV